MTRSLAVVTDVSLDAHRRTRERPVHFVNMFSAAIFTRLTDARRKVDFFARCVIIMASALVFRTFDSSERFMLPRRVLSAKTNYRE